jgi:KDO2-lipid IV(A) lauroyltransferase
MIARPDHAIPYAFGRLFMLMAQSVPLPSAVKLGEWAGRRMVRWTARNHEIGLNNLRHAFPGISPERAEALLIEMYSHFGRAAIEMAFAQRMLGPTTFRRHMEIVNEDVLHEARRAGKGAVFVTAHMGTWEILSVLLRNLRFETTTVYRPLSNPYFDGFIRRTRKRFGQTMVPRVGALPRLLRVLRRGGYIALLADQHAKRDGIWTPFFGRPASTTPAPALLALRTGAPIITGYVHRLPGPYRFEVVLDEPIRPESTGDREADVYRITAEISRRIESYVRRFPEQWLWVHRRWHRIPARVNEKGKADVRPSGQPA